MPIRSVQAFLDSLLEAQLLEESQLEELSRDERCRRLAGPEDLARELAARGWLTAYQAGRLLEGDARGLRLGPYQILEQLGRGGMGEVFKARHRNLHRLAAVKVIRKEHLSHPDAVLRFRREARAAARLEHPNIVTIYDADESGGVHFLAMEYVAGTDLARLVKERGPLPVPAACEYVRQAALGLQHAHEQGLVHRDIKPQNLMAARKGPGGQAVVKIADFGLARFASERAEDEGLTPTGQWMGTPEFIAPEQARDSKTADIRADIFSLGCTLFRLVTGEQAFPGQTSAEKISARLVGDALPLRGLRPEAPPELEAVLGRMMAREPAARYQTPAEVADALGPFCRGADAHELPPDPDGSAPTEAEQTHTGAAATGTETAAHTTPRPPAASTHQPSDTTAPGGPSTRPAPRRPARPWLVAGAAVLLVPAVVLAAWLLSRGEPADDTPPAGGPPPRPREADKVFTNSIGMKLVQVPAGSFLMGSPPGEEGRAADEGPQHRVTFDRPFYLGAFEVTQGEYEKVSGVNPSHFATTGEGRKQVEGRDTSRYPVETVSWEDARAFCRALSARPGEKVAGRTYRLPREAEWEYACRAGTEGPFHYGGVLSCVLANFDGNRPYGGAPKGVSRQNTVPVGMFPPNGFGLFDMHGNVWEWCEDWYERYADKLSHNLKEHRRDDDRVLRGGAWNFAAAECRSARRSARAPTLRGPYYGFRVLCETGPP
jgi:formylglycine-generating enzyme required for sulfatase activity/tRNA A-37 threonylcarbamoyl transferase component Bud32